jgi:hypothetical protein
MILWCRVTVVLILLFANGQAWAATLNGTDKSVRAIVSGIVSYTRWPALSGQPTLCIFTSSRYLKALSDAAPTPLPYTPVLVGDQRQALAAGCDAVYFGSESPEAQLELINAFHSRPLLLIAEQNSQCVVGSAFCLIINDLGVKFAVNLDALSRSGVRVNPDVLMLARNTKHE